MSIFLGGWVENIYNMAFSEIVKDTKSCTRQTQSERTDGNLGWAFALAMGLYQWQVSSIFKLWLKSRLRSKYKIRLYTSHYALLQVGYFVLKVLIHMTSCTKYPIGSNALWDVHRIFSYLYYYICYITCRKIKTNKENFQVKLTRKYYCVSVWNLI